MNSTDNENKMPIEFIEAAQSLAEAIIASEPFVQYQQALERLRADQKALDLLDSFWTSQGELRERQQKGTIRQSDIEAIRKLQTEVQATPVIMEYSQAQTNAVSLLKEVNREISGLVGLDFASLARRSCC